MQLDTINFSLPQALEATAPPEARGLRRDEVRLLVSHYQSDVLEQATFGDLGRFLHTGDLLVVNTSATLPAAVAGVRADGLPLTVHFSTQLSAETHIVELRQGDHSFRQNSAGDVITFPDGATLTLILPRVHSADSPTRLWIAALHSERPFHDFLHTHGQPIRYSYVDRAWPLAAYQTVFAQTAGSAEMPSAGRAFSAELVTRLVTQGVQFAPVVLHTGVASMEDHEPPYAEWFAVPTASAQLINAARHSGRRVIAVGTTAVRAVETATDENGWVTAAQGWTELIIGKTRPMRVINGLITGFHEPKATHLAMLAALASHAHLRVSYTAALKQRYLWHEFGDLHLLVA
ncbi:MAG TPA: S-adenosylmethionine:tRNA ribosyltransferase-isomerase [Anaerolineae bacterium]|nr:S-adenosylmethionine:tRNA ribosyltransferase-isomerase [Anaerolineae bacterium]